ncbi:hypothetical protein D0Z07_2401 [Hyphodiscus hymeniophilus]|uniref:Uncharacterized protein n=1 Tax=Hyphodiscus hymeniophilus TaxID=353542 RepID=A0A9P6VNK4_9HELO|nr:hypothetical protein D0Z07_2401 [Hyphodiscus hymeniophilus]
MSKHYRFEHTCGHIGIGPLIRTSALATSSQSTRSINLILPIRCPFCATTLPYLNVATGDGLLVILEPCTTLQESIDIPSPSSYISLRDSNYPIPGFEWRILRVCSASEITLSDWSLAQAPGQHYRQMAWIPKPCGIVRIDGSGGVADSRGPNRSVVEVDCSWRQIWKPGDVVKSRLPGMWSILKANLMVLGVDSGDGRRY